VLTKAQVRYLIIILTEVRYSILLLKLLLKCNKLQLHHYKIFQFQQKLHQHIIKGNTLFHSLIVIYVIFS